jgi:hypothetical protein
MVFIITKPSQIGPLRFPALSVGIRNPLPPR